MQEFVGNKDLAHNKEHKEVEGMAVDMAVGMEEEDMVSDMEEDMVLGMAYNMVCNM